MCDVGRVGRRQTEDDVPKGLKDGLHRANRIQDIARANMVPEMTGNQILNKTLEQMKDEGLDGLIYSHAIADWGHSAGSLIG